MSQSETGIPHKPEKVKHMAKFKVGDKVKVVESNYGKGTDLGAVGTVAANLEGAYIVDFHNVREFTWAKIDGGKGTGRIYKESEIALVKETPVHNWKVLILPDGDKTTALYYENGKVVKTEEVKRYFKDEYSVMNAVEAVTNKLFNNGFNWDGFMKTEFTVRFHKESDYDNFLKQCDERGIIWGGGQKASNKAISYHDGITLHCGLWGENRIAYSINSSHIHESCGKPIVEYGNECKVEEPEPKFKPGDFVEVVEAFFDCPAGLRGHVDRVRECNLCVNFHVKYAFTHDGELGGAETYYYIPESYLRKVN